jgi:DNA-binding transcriptional MerR regulator
MFTVKQLSQIAGVTPRTLHYYDEIGSLKPSRVGENGYRYYGKEAVLIGGKNLRLQIGRKGLK